jgi:hypothetical protein
MRGLIVSCGVLIRKGMAGTACVAGKAIWQFGTSFVHSYSYIVDVYDDAAVLHLRASQLYIYM